MSASEITRILESGQADAVERVMPLVYDELRAMAAAQLQHERADHTLQPTALVHELYVKMVGSNAMDPQNRRHFFAMAAGCIRQVLIDHARREKAEKRGRDWARITLDTPVAAIDTPTIDVLSLNEALEALQAIDPRRARIVELRIFGGMSGDEIADHLDLSRTTISKEWRFARAWLTRALKE